MLFCILFLICSPRSSGTDVTSLLHFQLVYNHSVLLLWDEVPNAFHEVKVTVNYENNSTEYFTVNAPFSDKGLVLHDLQPHLYVVLISFFIDGLMATSSLPILLSLAEKGIDNGVFDILGKLQPTKSKFAYNSTFWDGLTEYNINMLQTNILTDAAISSLAFTQKYKKFLMVTDKIVINYGVNGIHQRLADILTSISSSNGQPNLVLRKDPSHNIALFKKVESSSTYGSYHAVLAVDGDKTGFFHTQEETDPFLQIDIGYSSLIRKVIIYNRNNNNVIGSRLQNFKVFVGQNTAYESNKVCIHDTSPTGNQDEIEADCMISVNGRYVHLVSFGFKYMNLREVEVYGYEGLQNLALFGTATIAGVAHDDHETEKGIDGLFFSYNNFMHTSSQINAYLRIRLKSSAVIFLAVVYNRNDDRLNDFGVNVGFNEDGLSNPICGKRGVVEHLYGMTIDCERPMFGDYAQLTLDGTDQLTIDEFEVIGYEDKVVSEDYSVSYFDNPSFAKLSAQVSSTQGFAIGFRDEPYVGFYRPNLFNTLLIEPSPVAFLGVRDILPLETSIIDRICVSALECGLGIWRFFTLYTKLNSNHKAFFYSANIDNVCFYKECPFAAPASLVLQNISSTTMTIGWDAIDTQGLVNPKGFQYYLINTTNMTLERTSSLTTLLSQLYIEELLIGTEYQFIVAGVASGVVGNWSQPVTFKTHEEVPTGTAEHFRAETINSTSVVLKWEPVKKELVRGTLEGYQLKIFWEKQEMVLNISVVMEYMVGNFQPYTNYKFALKVMNSMYVAENLTVVNITTPMAVPAALVTYTTLTAVSPFGFNISWDHANLKQVYGPLKGYLLSLYPAENNTRNISVGPVQSYQFLNLKPFINYTVQIFTENDNYLSTNATVIQARTLPLSPGLPPRDLTASNTSSTSLNVSWKDILNEGWGDDYKRLGFQITLKQDNYTHQLFVLYNETYSIEIKSLSVYTKYTVQVAGVNEKGTGVSALCMTYTNEEAPVTAPSLTVAKALSPNTGFVQWKAFKTNLGNVRAYTITVSALRFARKRKRRAVLANALNQQIFINSNILNYTITGLNGGMDYDVKIAAQTLYLGVYSQSVTITTPVGVPLLSARNISCSLMDSTSLLVLWRESAKISHQGPLAKYRVYYLEDESNVSKHVDVKATGRLEAQLFFLKPLREYQINITAFTSAGEGAITTEDIICVPQGVPGSAPLNVEVKTIDKSNRALVTWNDISDWNTLASKTYHLHIIHISNGKGLPTNEPVTHTTGHVTSFVLKNLEAFSTYQVTVSACTRQGCGRKSEEVFFDTCQLFSEKIVFQYKSMFPFSFYDNNTRKVEGTLIKVAKQAVLHCTETCGSISAQQIYFSYEEHSSNSTTSLNMTSNRLILPFIEPLIASDDATFSELYKTFGFALITILNDPVGEGEVVVTNGVTDVIPLCGLLLLINAIFGIFWCILDSTWESGNCTTLKGFFNGVYLAFMTSTTVGYGDVYPTTIKGRLYIVCWTLLGLVLTSIVVGNLSSSLTTSTVLSTKDDSLPTEEKIIAVHGSPSYVFADKKLPKFERNKTYHFAGDVLKQLYKKKYKFALLDVFTLVLYEELFKNYDLEIKKVFPIESSLQVGLYGDLKKYSHCIAKFALTNQDIVDNSKSEILKRYRKSSTRKSNKTTSQGTPRTSSHAPTLLSSESKLFQSILFNQIIALAALLVIGSFYEGFRRRRVTKVFSELNLQLARYEKARAAALQLKEDMRELVLNFGKNTFDIHYKQGEQLLHLINCLSRLYGVNVKYIKLSELALSPEEMWRFKKGVVKSK